MPNYEITQPNYPNHSVPNSERDTFMSEYEAWATKQEHRITAQEMRGEVLEVPDFEYLYQQECIKNKTLVANHALFSKFLTEVMPNIMNDDDSWEYLEGMIEQGLLPDPRRFKISVSLNLGVDQRLHLVVPYTYDTHSSEHGDILSEINDWLGRQSSVLQPMIDVAMEFITLTFAQRGHTVEVSNMSAPRANNAIYMSRMSREDGGW